MPIPSKARLFWLPFLCVAGALAGCGGDGGSPSAPEPSAPAPPLEVPFGFTDLEEGEGVLVEDGWLLAIAFTAWLYDPAAPDNKGLEFWSSPEGGATHFRLGVGQAIPGLDDGVAGMRVGGARRIVIPPDKGYGARGTNLVPANATLLFEVELVAAAEVPFGFTDLEIGTGEAAASGRSLSMAYHGWLYDLLAENNRGDSFDSTTAAAPFEFTLGVGRVIAGWDLGIVGMRVGGKRRIVIPHELAYGAAGRPGIPSYATLLFEVELLEVN